MVRIGIYEKALPSNWTWQERLDAVKNLGFDFLEMSIDESDERLARLDWSDEQITRLKQAIDASGISIHSLCLSGHRRFPFGSADRDKQAQALAMMKKAIKLAYRLGIRIIQVAGYDVYYEEKSIETRESFIRGMRASIKEAAQYGIILSVEIMDDPFMNSIRKFMYLKKQIPSPYLQVYPDLGNLSAWPENDVSVELEQGIEYITSIHLKDTQSVTTNSQGKFREVVFGQGCVDFTGVLQTLKRLNYEGTFLIEMWSGADHDYEQQILEAKNYLLPKLKEAGF
ncbi:MULTISPECIES: L-ribulose-5-phosphate 3-epimerase [unclassified Enterococcus]|uniref:L-ribulose-5-phosphate 3-epimerase n=1 Tax=unclassified Enterococcus TaxID=2608891 RepID=UPI001A9B803B|nr:L-ribulose-5-phosphate 3-epimerase [Enterococcus sp. DIV1271a]MBO1299100.1 L-ribulose-5-phosphate 3-epimerase [Enterococcus sp. DIV1271a]